MLVRCPLRSLFKCVQHVDRLGVLRHIEHTMFLLRVNPKLKDASANAGNGLGIRRRPCFLNSTQFEARSSPGVIRKGQEIAVCGTHPTQRLYYISTCMSRHLSIFRNSLSTAAEDRTPG